MPSAGTETMVKMLETLPERLQGRVLERVREFIEEIREEGQWAESSSRSQDKLVVAARRAMSEGNATHLDIEKL